MCDMVFVIVWPRVTKADIARVATTPLDFASIDLCTHLGKINNLCSPNEDFGNRNSRSGVSFRRTLRGCEYSIWATNPRKVPRKHTPDLLFRFPKSSFGRHKIVRSLLGFLSHTALESNRPVSCVCNSCPFVRQYPFRPFRRVSTSNPGWNS